jgi:hypothetical protein
MVFDFLHYYLKRKLSRLNYDFHRFTMASFVRCVEAHRGRGIEFIPTAFPPGYYGAWITDKDEPLEYVCFDADLPRLHREHVKLHELAHIICGHETLALSNNEMKKLLESGGDLSALLCRSNEMKSDRSEREAEMMAGLIQTMVYGPAGPVKLVSSSATGKSYLSIFCDREQK